MSVDKQKWDRNKPAASLGQPNFRREQKLSFPDARELIEHDKRS